MAVKKHPSILGAWQIDWSVPDTSKKRRKSGKYPLKRCYETYIGEYEDAVSRWSSLCQEHRSKHSTIGNPRLEEVFPEYLSYIELNKSHGYYKSVCWAEKKLKPFFGKLPASHINKDKIEEFKRLHRDTPAHTNQCLQYLSIMINWMASCDPPKAQRLPFKIQLLPHKKGIPQPPSPEEFELIIDTVKENFKKSGTSDEQRAKQEAIIRLIYDTGLRFHEARFLEWQNLRWSDGRCKVSTTKTDVDRYCLFPEEVMELIRPYKKKFGYIFTNPQTGKPYTNIRRGLVAAAKEHGIPLRGPHDLRHAAGTDALEATGDIRAVQDLLGHADLKSTQVYTHIAVKRRQRIAAATAEFRKKEREETKKKNKDNKDV